MAVRLKPTEKILLELGIEKDGPIQKYFVERCKDYMERFVPMRPGSGKLREAKIDGNRIIYDQIYARYQFYGHRQDGSHQINPANYSTPGTGPRWDKRMKSAFMPTIKQEILKEIEKRRSK